MSSTLGMRVWNALEAAGLLPAAFRLYKSVREWRPAMELENLRLRRRARRGLPLPPGDLVFLVTASRDLRWFLTTGERSAKEIADAVRAVGRPIESIGRVLDFGCGCGRVLRHWERLPPGSGHGSDYNARAIAWVARNLPFVSASVNGLAPPLAYPDASFDLVYALSVFTHLTPELEQRWLAELRRVLRPGGLVLLTTAGALYRDKLTPEQRTRFDAGESIVRSESLVGTNLCAAYHPEAYVRRRFTDGFRLLSFREGGAPGIRTQDAYILERSA